MKFHRVEPNQVIHQCRCLSEEEKWEIGFRQMLFGVRVSLSRIGDEFYTLDYCAADDVGFALLLFATILQILDRYPEDVTPQQLERDFPRYEIKPINRDPHCWPRLQQMAIEAQEAKVSDLA